MKGINVLTNSRASCYLTCPRKHDIAYNRGIRPTTVSHALNFGTLMHKLLESYWKHGETLRVSSDGVHPLDWAKATALMRGYIERWHRVDEDAKTLAVELAFECPLLDPETMDRHPIYRMGGKLDLIIERGGTLCIMDHKTTSEDISPASRYWDRVSMSPQMTQYFVGAESLGHHCTEFVFDVIRKPTISLLDATPEESRKYKKDGTLYANQREFSETIEDYSTRLEDDIGSRPEFYFQRRSFRRDDAMVRDHLRDIWNIAPALVWPSFKNPDSCKKFGDCEYLPICADGLDPLEHPELYRVVDNVHEEL